MSYRTYYFGLTGRGMQPSVLNNKDIDLFHSVKLDIKNYVGKNRNIRKVKHSFDRRQAYTHAEGEKL